MSEHRAEVRWTNTGTEFLRGKFSREHSWAFDGGVTVPASASPDVVRAPYSNPAGVDPEEAFVAAIASCHMLSFLWVASRAGFEVTSYEDAAVGVLSRNERGGQWISAVRLQPRIVYTGAVPSPEQESELHDAAHGECFIANSVRTAITVAR